MLIFCRTDTRGGVGEYQNFCLTSENLSKCLKKVFTIFYVFKIANRDFKSIFFFKSFFFHGNFFCFFQGFIIFGDQNLKSASFEVFFASYWKLTLKFTQTRIGLFANNYQFLSKNDFISVKSPLGFQRLIFEHSMVRQKMYFFLVPLTFDLLWISITVSSALSSEFS